jgi:hypothetical protein
MAEPVLTSKDAVYVFTPFDGPGFCPIVDGEEGIQCSPTWCATRGVGASSLAQFFGLFAHMTNHVRGYSSCPVTAILTYADTLWRRGAATTARPRVPVPPLTLVSPNPAMGKGSRKEDAIIGLVEQQFGVLTVPGGVYYGTGPWAFMRVSLDRIIAAVPGDGRRPTPADMVIVEAKCKLRPDKQFMGEPPTLAYFMQCQVQCAVLGAGCAWLATGYVPCDIALSEVRAQNAEIAALQVPTVFRQDTQTIPMCADWARVAAATGQPESFVHVVTILRHERAIAALLDAMTQMHNLAVAIAAGTASDDPDSVEREWRAIMAASDVIAICEAARAEAVLPSPQTKGNMKQLPRKVVRRTVASDGTRVDHPALHVPFLPAASSMQLITARDELVNECELQAALIRDVPEAAVATRDCGDVLYALADGRKQNTQVATLRSLLRLFVHGFDVARIGPKFPSVFDGPPSEPNHWTIAFHAHKVACGEREVVDRAALRDQYPEVREFSGGHMVVRGIRHFPSPAGDVIVLSFTPSKEIVELKRAVFAARPHLAVELAAAYAERVAAGDGDDASLSTPDHPDTWHMTLGTVTRGMGIAAVAMLCALTNLPVACGFRYDAVSAILPAMNVQSTIDELVENMGPDYSMKQGDVFKVHSLAVCTAVSDAVISIWNPAVPVGLFGVARDVEEDDTATKRVKVEDPAVCVCVTPFTE